MRSYTLALSRRILHSPPTREYRPQHHRFLNLDGKSNFRCLSGRSMTGNMAGAMASESKLPRNRSSPASASATVADAEAESTPASTAPTRTEYENAKNADRDRLPDLETQSQSRSSQPQSQSQSTQTTSSPVPPPPQPPLALPEVADPTDSTPVTTLTLNQPLKLDHLGPMVVNVDGTLSRIANWEAMTEGERANVVRVVGRRNRVRLEGLRGKEVEDG